MEVLFYIIDETRFSEKLLVLITMMILNNTKELPCNAKHRLFKNTNYGDLEYVFTRLESVMS